VLVVLRECWGSGDGRAATMPCCNTTKSRNTWIGKATCPNPLNQPSTRTKQHFVSIILGHSEPCFYTFLAVQLPSSTQTHKYKLLLSLEIVLRSVGDVLIYSASQEIWLLRCHQQRKRIMRDKEGMMSSPNWKVLCWVDDIYIRKMSEGKRRLGDRHTGSGDCINSFVYQ
jgi:hypothetical protein